MRTYWLPLAPLAVCLTALTGCTTLTCAVGGKCLSDEDTEAIDEWLLCEECTDELDRVLNDIGWRSIRRLAGALHRPPAHRLDRYQRQLRDSHRRSGSSLPQAEYVAFYSANYVAKYQKRAAIALGELAARGGFGSGRARDELQHALDEYDAGNRAYRDDALTEIRRALSKATGTTLWASVSAGSEFTCARSTGSDAFCWGQNDVGQLGNGTLTGELVPVSVSRGTGFATVDAAIGFHACTMRSSGYAYCWGDNTAGQLGDGTNLQRLEPTAVLENHPITRVSVGGWHTCADSVSNGSILCWGANIYGQLGLGGLSPTDTFLPAQVVQPVMLSSVTLGMMHTCAIEFSIAVTPGRVYCWGWNFRGQVGDGTSTDRYAPVPVAVPITDFIAVDAGWYHNCAVRDGGAVHCWGWNGWGQVGDGTTIQRNTPTPIASAEVFQSVSARYVHSCGVTAVGTAYCWGQNNVGQLGDGTLTDRSAPALVAGGLSFTAISAGYDHTCALTTDETIYCWGSGAAGQLGNGSTASSLVPTRISEPQP